MLSQTRISLEECGFFMRLYLRTAYLALYRHVPMRKYMRTITWPTALLIIIILSSCANRPYFRIENHSDEVVRVEMVLDTVDLPEVVARFITNRNRNLDYCTDCVRDHACDSIYQQLKLTENSVLLQKYLYDSLELASFFHYRYNVGNAFTEFEL